MVLTVALRIRVDVTQSVDDVLPPSQIRAAGRRAARRAAVTGRKAANPEVRQATGLKSRAVTSSIQIPRGVRSDGSVSIRASGRPLNLAAYGARQARRGVRAMPYGKRRLFPGAFFISGEVARRTREAQNPRRPGRLTKHTQGIEYLYGPGVAETFVDVTDREQWQALVLRRVREVFAQEIRFRISKGAGR